MDIFDGRISSSGFSSGDRIVVGDWEKSPLGPFTNVMWAKPDGTRILLSPTQEYADYVSKLYNFEEVQVVPIDVNRQQRGIDIVAGPLNISFRWKRGIGIPFGRPRWLISTIEQSLETNNSNKPVTFSTNESTALPVKSSEFANPSASARCKPVTGST